MLETDLLSLLSYSCGMKSLMYLKKKMSTKTNDKINFNEKDVKGSGNSNSNGEPKEVNNKSFTTETITQNSLDEQNADGRKNSNSSGEPKEANNKPCLTETITQNSSDEQSVNVSGNFNSSGEPKEVNNKPCSMKTITQNSSDEQNINGSGNSKSSGGQKEANNKSCSTKTITQNAYSSNEPIVNGTGNSNSRKKPKEATGESSLYMMRKKLFDMKWYKQILIISILAFVVVYFCIIPYIKFKVIEQLEADAPELLRRYKEANQQFQFFEEKMNVLKSEINKHQLLNTISQHSEYIKDHTDKLEKLSGLDVYTSEKLPSLDSKLKTIEEKIDSTSWQFWINVILISAVFMLLFRSFFPDHFREFPLRSATDDREQTTGPQSVLDRIPTNPTLEYKICCVSFTSSSESSNKALLTTIINESIENCLSDITCFTISGPNDVLKMPKVKFSFIFIDFNERNVILENKGQDAGEKKLVTVKAAINFGSKVFVIYKDPGSKQLEGNQLYNPKLLQFKEHPVLKELEAKRCCLSVYDHFNETQQQHIIDMIK